MAAPRYLTLLDVVGLHAIVMERTGCLPAPLRSEAALESALMRPQMAAYDENADVVRQCVFLAVGISQAEAWLDGNKRTSYAAADVFLRLNGYAFSGDPLALAKQLEDLASREGSIDEATDRFERWLRDRVERL